jgi:hypothetical protein
MSYTTVAANKYQIIPSNKAVKEKEQFQKGSEEEL